MPKKKEKEYLKEHYRDIGHVPSSVKEAEEMRRKWQKRGYEVQFYRYDTDATGVTRLAIRKLSPASITQAQEKERKDFLKAAEEESKQLRKEIYGSRKFPRITPKTPRLRR